MFKPTHPIKNNFQLIKDANKTVSLHLRSGEKLDGKLGEWSDAYVVLTELVGKEFYDAMVRVDAIVAISIRAR